jgi:hypothetical protein
MRSFAEQRYSIDAGAVRPDIAEGGSPQPCALPFRAGGRLHCTCTSQGSHTPWCPLAAHAAEFSRVTLNGSTAASTAYGRSVAPHTWGYCSRPASKPHLYTVPLYAPFSAFRGRPLNVTLPRAVSCSPNATFASFVEGAASAGEQPPKDVLGAGSRVTIVGRLLPADVAAAATTPAVAVQVSLRTGPAS